MKVFCLGALGLGLCIGLLAAAEPASKKSKDDQRVISNATGGDESAADEETAADEESGEEPDDDDESKPAKKDDDSRPEVKKKPPVRGLAAKDQELVKKANYMVAAQWAQGLSSEGFEFDLDEVVRGIKDALGGKAQAFTPEEYKECLLVMQQKMVENKDKRSKLFLEENKKKEGVKTTKSGLQYKVLKTGTGAAPKATDTVTFHYKGTFTDGQEFESSYRSNMPATLEVNRMIKGWTEALQMMKIGDKWQLFVPADLAYGPSGRKDPRSGQFIIPPNATLLFELELLSIKGSPRDE